MFVKGRTVAILASGPSMSLQVADAVRQTSLPAVAINDTYRLTGWADALFAGDARWWCAHPEALDFVGEKFCCDDLSIRTVQTVPRREGLKDGGNSALRAAHMLASLGVKKILLFGVDLRDDAVTHWHGPHGHGLPNPTALAFGRFRRAWEMFAAEKDRPEVVNCNPESALQCFPKLALDEALA